LDVVYNHTAEGNHFGPVFNFKGADNLAYYKTVEGDERFVPFFLFYSHFYINYLTSPTGFTSIIRGAEIL
jgi:hypothetical protein